MKKALFLLTQAAGVACADTNLSELTHLTIQQNSVDFTTESSSAYASVILSQEAITKLKAGTSINKMLFAFNEMDGIATEHVGVGVSTYFGYAIRVTGALSGTSNISGASTYYSAWPNDSAGQTMEVLLGSAQYAVLTMGITGSGSDTLIMTTVNSAGSITHTTFTKSCSHADFTYSGNVAGFSTNTVSGLVTEGGASTGTWTETSLKSLGTSVIRLLPEPTTATLSLLALVGLAARRRCR